MPDLAPLAAFDIFDDGRTVPVAAPWPAPSPEGGARWRWLHLNLADPALPAWLAEQLPPLPAAALIQTETRPRCNAHDGGLMLNLRAVNLNPGEETDDMVSLRLWVGENAIVSARIRKVFAVDALRQTAEAGTAPVSPAAFLEALTRGLTDRLEAVSLDLADQTVEMEEVVYEEEAHLPEPLAPLRRQVLRLRRYVGPQREALNRLAQTQPPLIPPAVSAQLAETANRATRTVEELDALAARLGTLQDHLNAEHHARMGRNGYVLSVVAAIFLPLGFLTGVFGVNVAGMPGTQWPWAFAVLSGAMAAIGLGLFAVFRWMRWF